MYYIIQGQVAQEGAGRAHAAEPPQPRRREGPHVPII